MARRRYVDEVLWPEDKRICESVQRGLGSIVYKQGRYMIGPTINGPSEVVCHHLMKLNLSALGIEI